MANDICQVFAVGRLTRDGELKILPNGTPLLEFAIAIGKKAKDLEETSFFHCTIYGKFAEVIGKFMVKGQQVAVTGELKQERWEKDGVKHSKVKIRVDQLNLLGGKGVGTSVGLTKEEEEIPF